MTLKKTAKIRLFVESPLHLGEQILLSEKQSHYLQNVMKREKGSRILCFDGKSGEYECELVECGKKICRAKVLQKAQDFYGCPDIWLLFAPVKKDQTDFIIQKATELGVKKIIPVITERTISDKVKKERFVLQAVEACEQCRRVDVPAVEEAVPMDKLFSVWEPTRRLYFMDETGGGKNIREAFAHASAPAAVLVGPEGGFSEKELEKLRKQPYTEAVTMGKRILRAETAVAAALSCWQALSGDWTD